MASKGDKDLQSLTLQEAQGKTHEEVKSKTEIMQVPTDTPTDLVTYYVHEALVRFLPGYTVKTYQGVEPNSSDNAVVMQVRRRDEVRLTPDPFGRYLAYGRTQTRYTLHVATENGYWYYKKFTYQWEDGRRTFVTCPFHNQNPVAGQRVPCNTSPISQALEVDDPISAIVKVLKTIRSNREGDNNGLDGPDFVWTQSGPNENFSISVPDTMLFWEDINDGRIGSLPKPGIRLTQEENNKLRLMLTDV